VAELHRRASAWHEQRGDVASAVAHALAAKDPAHVVALIEAYGFPMLLRGELNLLLNWIAASPEEMVLANPRVCIYHAWALLLTGQLAQIESRLQSAERHPLDHADQNLLGHIATIWAYVASMHGDMARAVELARLALERLDADDQAIRAVLRTMLQMPGQAGIAAVVSLAREGSEAMRQVAIEAVLQSDRWQVRMELEALCGDAHMRLLVEQVERTLKSQPATATGSGAIILRLDTDSIRSAVLN
jgi:ATP/maltotriose-dependent transcriptional regulator MalT